MQDYQIPGGIFYSPSLSALGTRRRLPAGQARHHPCRPAAPGPSPLVHHASRWPGLPRLRTLPAWIKAAFRPPKWSLGVRSSPGRGSGPGVIVNHGRRQRSGAPAARASGREQTTTRQAEANLCREPGTRNTSGYEGAIHLLGSRANVPSACCGVGRLSRHPRQLAGHHDTCPVMCRRRAMWDLSQRDARTRSAQVGTRG